MTPKTLVTPVHAQGEKFPPVRPGLVSLPETPIVTIEANHSWRGLDPRALWAYRELLYFLTWRDLKVRYKQTLFGVAWVILQPVLLTVIFTIFLGVLVRVPTEGVPYPLMVFTGLMPWTFFSSAASGSVHSLVGNANLITKVYFPRVFVPTASVAARLVDFTISLTILIGLFAYYGVMRDYPIAFTWKLLSLPLLIAMTMLFTLAFGVLVAAINVKYRDVGVILPVLIQLWMFLSPVIYPASLVPEKWRMLYFLNPMAGIIESFRSVLLGYELNLFGLVVSVAITILLMTASAYVFRQTEKSFADVI